MGMLRKIKTAPLEQEMEQELTRRRKAAAEAPFDVAPYDPERAEKSGYSNYSYWGSTFRVFLKNRMAVTLLCVLLVLVLFTVIQPCLPGQYPANLIINHPTTNMQMSNVAPSLTTVKARAQAGIALTVTSYDNPEWSAVSNVLATLKARTEFTVLEYGDQYCRISYDDMTGYVKNDFSTKLKLPDDYENTPYTARSNFALKVYSAPGDYTNNGDPLFVRTECLDIDGDQAVTNRTCELRILPSTAPFLLSLIHI